MALRSGIVIAPDRERDGTNLISLPTEVNFCFSYGKGSFSRHLARARQLGMPVHVLMEEDLSFDVDTPQDYIALRASLPGNRIPFGAAVIEPSTARSRGDQEE